MCGVLSQLLSLESLSLELTTFEWITSGRLPYAWPPLSVSQPPTTLVSPIPAPVPEHMEKTTATSAT
ncbi:uncharacterized protein SEPMUDRAFT_148067 [Sphaerulina musiva SO2202]|uniref:Uncharacterized protein n=1 Tax=Sphaerulina musiva (strain SO2202) TaxID=692275 RepID=M3C1Y3_SPHMS|nr:uncharacterized protein SEPMUDRAFT_148067 [Sphaerulina musiva SO2202]EMF14316.1 hypothetical protein SEPMUDRAFT_148067 [Sphaerulina musiva SO2202]